MSWSPIGRVSYSILIEMMIARLFSRLLSEFIHLSATEAKTRNNTFIIRKVRGGPGHTQFTIWMIIRHLGFVCWICLQAETTLNNHFDRICTKWKDFSFIRQISAVNVILLCLTCDRHPSSTPTEWLRSVNYGWQRYSETKKVHNTRQSNPCFTPFSIKSRECDDFLLIALTLSSTTLATATCRWLILNS